MAVIIGIWVVWYALHSWLATLCVKKQVQRWSPDLFRYYRLLYNGVALATFALALYFHWLQPDVVMLRLPALLIWVGWLFLAGGLVVTGIALLNYNLGEFAGIDKMTEFNDVKDALVVKGLNSWVRHPLYTGSLMVLTGLLLVFFTRNTMIFALVSVLYIFIGSVLEERKLVHVWGEEYIQYRRRTGRFFPTQHLFRKRP